MLSGLCDELCARHGPAGMSAELRTVSRKEAQTQEKADEEVTEAAS